MRSHLLYEDREIGSQGAYSFSADLIKDLNLSVIFKTMAKEDMDIRDAAQKVMLMPLANEKEIRYRQEVIGDVLRCPEMIDKIRGIAKDVCRMLSSGSEKPLQPRGKMIEDLTTIQNLIEAALGVRKIIRSSKERFFSKGFRTLIESVEKYDWDAIRENAEAMNFISSGGELGVSLELGRGLKLSHIRIENCVGGKGKLTEDNRFVKLANKLTKSNYLYLEEESLVRDAHLLQEAAMRHLLGRYETFYGKLAYFFRVLYFELNFYYGVYQLHSRFTELKIPLAMPKVNTEKIFHFEELYEMTLAIYSRSMPVTNNLTEEDKRLTVITGANQGGKSTFLRSIGIAQVLLQCGMFVPAKAYSNGLYKNILTHFARREDQQMNSGRLEEEIIRMDKMIETLDHQSMVLLNESFASTTEKEGSVIAGDITRALYEAGIDVFMVTHLYAFARDVFEKNWEHALFLSAERKEDGRRTYKMIEKEPSHTIYGLDLFEEIIGAAGV